MNQASPFKTEAFATRGFVFDGKLPLAPPDMLVKGLLPVEGIGIIGGQSGAGKTFVLTQLGVCLGSGTPFFGRKVRERVGVAIMAAEGASTLAIRVEVARRNMLTDHSPLPIAWLGDVPDLSEPKEIDALVPRLEAVGKHFKSEFGVRLGVVAFDTLSAAFALDDENSNSESAKICRQLRRLGSATGALMLPVHHYGKGVDTGLRGASGWRANSDAVLSILADRNQITGKVSRRSLALAKSRVVEEGPIADFSLRFVEMGIDEDGDAFGSCYVEPTAAPSDESRTGRAPSLTKASQTALRALEEIVIEFGRVPAASNHIPANLSTVDLNRWREHAYLRGISGSDEPRAKQKAFKCAFDALLASKRIGFWDGQIWIV